MRSNNEKVNMPKSNKFYQTLFSFLTAVTAVVSLSVDAGEMHEYSAVPPFSIRDAGPSNIMLTLSLDHQLFFEAYNDYEDLTGDGFPETTYVNSLDYVGYFNNNLCYLYSSGRFEPSHSLDNNGYCSTNGWSGNFLNWLTMTRMDMVRMVLYGGYRSLDQPDETVLERAYLPQDAHSFAKFYDGNDLANLVVESDLPSTDLSAGYTFCNTSLPTIHNSSTATGDSKSHLGAELTTPPIIRAVAGNYSLWASNERFQCAVREEMPGQFDIGGALWGAINNGEISQAQITDEYLPFLIQFGVNGNNNPAATGIPAMNITPTSSQVENLNVRVKVCDGSVDVDEDRCLAYGTSSKPYGVLQRNAADFRNFGLITGSYESNKSYGVLRKGLAPLSTEINDNGTFKVAPISGASDGANTPDSIIGTLNALRIVDYQFWGGDANYQGTYNGSGCSFQLVDPDNGVCKNWGNPFSEILAESYRYFAKTAQASVDVSGERGLLPGLSVAQWPTTNQQSEGEQDGEGESTDSAIEACARNSVVAFNTSAVSYDGDELAGLKPFDIGIGAETGEGGLSIDDLTDGIGAQEDLSLSYFIGQILGQDNVNNGLCSAKSGLQGDLSEVRGTCPETPRLGGSYLGAGLAYFAHNNDVNPSTPDKETVATYGVTLSPEVPKIQLTAGNNAITIVPTCRNLGRDGSRGPDGNGLGNCSLVDFKPIDVTSSAGFYYIGWEDSEQGGDYDLDLSGTIKYQVSGNSLQIETHIIYESAPDDMEFGYAVTGTGDPALDRVYFPSRITQDEPNRNAAAELVLEILSAGVGEDTTAAETQLSNFSEVDPSTATDWCLGATTGSYTCAESVNGNTRIQRVSLTLNSASEGDVVPAEFLESPLYYAAKWGSFDNSSSTIIENESQWKKGGDMIGYEQASNPIALREKLDRTISQAGILPAVSTGTNQIVTSVIGEGIALQTFYYPELTVDEQSLSWVGTMTALFIDTTGVLREDSNDNGRLDAGDKGIRFVYNNEEKTTTILRFDGAAPGDAAEELNFSQLSSIKFVWSANSELDSVTDYVVQRQNLNANVGQNRFILTAVDQKPEGINTERDGQIDNLESVPFDVATSVDTLAPLLDLGEGDPSAADLINYIRGDSSNEGDEDGKLRVRSTTNQKYLLGDIVNSQPAVVGRPYGNYSREYGDYSYLDFMNTHKNRRSMVYVGANDGMLHAFDNGADNDSENEGDFIRSAEELWAYVPYNLLPHLKWLAKRDYSHVFYMDGPIHTFDVNIFTESNTYKNGWGTILVAGMRFGGGEYELNVGSEEDADLRTLRSAYVIFDITDPYAPKLLGEITDPNLGFTTSNVELIVRREFTITEQEVEVGEEGEVEVTTNQDVTTNDWYLVFGSGPQGSNGLTGAVSDANAHLFYLDLNELALGNVELQSVEISAADGGKSFVGGITAKDWDGDYYTDAIYFGLVGDGAVAEGETQANAGRLMYTAVDRTSPNLFSTSSVKTMLAGVNKPFSAAPTAVSDRMGNRWVYATTGRLYVNEDAKLSNDQHSLYGINVKDIANSTNGINVTDLLDVTDFRTYVNADGTDLVREVDAANNDKSIPTRDGAELGNVSAVMDYLLANKKGWVRDYRATGEKSYLSPVYSNDTIFAASFNPMVADACETDGRSYLYAVDMFTGLAQTRRSTLVFGDDSVSSGNVDYQEVETVIVDDLAGALTDLYVLGEKLPLGTDKGDSDEANSGLEQPKVKREAWREILLEELN